MRARFRAKAGVTQQVRTGVQGHFKQAQGNAPLLTNVRKGIQTQYRLQLPAAEPLALKVL